MNTKKIGDYGEEVACEYLLNTGYKILERNFIALGCEVDIICQVQKSNNKDEIGTVVFVEVKSRANTGFGEPSEAVTVKKQQRIVTAAKSYIVKRKLRNTDIRFDVIELNGNDINHIKGAFFAN